MEIFTIKADNNWKYNVRERDKDSARKTFECNHPELTAVVIQSESEAIEESLSKGFE